MDELSYGIFKKICSLTKIGKYVIVSADEFGGDEDPDEVKKVLDRLCNDGFIDVKYSGEDMFCLTPLKNAPEPEVKPQPVKKKKIKINPVLSSFLGGMLGGLLGSLLILIFAVIYA